MVKGGKTIYFGSATLPNHNATFDVVWGAKVYAARKNAGLTQEQLAKLVGLERTSITNIETGKQILKLETAIKIFSACGVDIITPEINQQPAGQE
jgi:DNA-binding XRE family transcriptional regulator